MVNAKVSEPNVFIHMEHLLMVVLEPDRMIDQYNIKGTPEVYTIAVNSHSQIGDWEFAYSVYTDMTRKGVVPDEVFL